MTIGERVHGGKASRVRQRSMTFFEDMGQYRYAGGADGALNVGWLSRKHPFAIRGATLVFQDKLG